VYEYLDAAVVRAPASHLGNGGLPWPDLTGPDAGPGSWQGWLDRVWQLTDFRCAVQAASPDLARRVDEILAGRQVPEPDLRRAVLATLRYLLRFTSRATPFGLLAGVAPARIGAGPAAPAGTSHHATARVAAEWITDVIEHLECDAELRPCLMVIASNLVIRRDGHLVIQHLPGRTIGGGPLQVRIRATPPALAALDCARRPIRVAGLAALLTGRFHDVPGTVIDGFLAELIQQRFLITNLRPPMTAPDPLAALLAELDSLDRPAVTGSPEVIRLRAIGAAIARHDEAPCRAAARDQRARAHALMADVSGNSKPALAIDLRLDWDVVIPQTVAAEAAAAAAALARLSARPALSSGWVAWHARFLERYGPAAAVPVLDAVDPCTGLGYPAGYLGSPAAGPGPLTSRDKTLLKLASTAVARGVSEVTLDDVMVAELAAAGPGDPVQPSAELTVRLHARSLGAVQQGQFTLHLTGVSRAAGATAGRFLSMFDRQDRERMLELYAAVPGVHAGGLLAQVSTVPLYVSTENVARALQVAGLIISLGEHRKPGADQIPVTDLAVTADARRLHLVSLSRRRPVHTILANAVDLAYHTDPLARFLVEAPAALVAPCSGFEWGAASVLPCLPSLRYRRTVLSPARWMLTASDLPASGTGQDQWDDALASFTEQARLPGRVFLGDGDQCLSLDLTVPAHRVLLRTHLDRAGRALLRPAPGPQDLRWAGGRTHEIVIPVAAAAPALDPVRWPGEVTRACHGHLPGCDGRLYLKLYCPRGQQDSILLRQLPALLGQLDGQVRWWFIRYSDPEEHLRLRLTLPPGTSSPAAGQVGAWTQRLCRAGLVARVSWDTYYPETARFGGSAVINAAEEFFAADSAATLAQLAMTGAKDGPDIQAMTAASMADITAGLIGDRAQAMRWLAERAQSSARPPRVQYDQAVALACLPDGRVTRTSPLDARVAESWLSRRSALAAYRTVLGQAGTIRLAELLPDLLHLHHVRMAGADLDQERTALHLARAAALSWLARGAKTSDS